MALKISPQDFASQNEIPVPFQPPIQPVQLQTNGTTDPINGMHFTSKELIVFGAIVIVAIVAIVAIVRSKK